VERERKDILAKDKNKNLIFNQSLIYSIHNSYIRKSMNLVELYLKTQKIVIAEKDYL